MRTRLPAYLVDAVRGHGSLQHNRCDCKQQHIHKRTLYTPRAVDALPEGSVAFDKRILTTDSTDSASSSPCGGHQQAAHVRKGQHSYHVTAALLKGDHAIGSVLQQSRRAAVARLLSELHRKRTLRSFHCLACNTRHTSAQSRATHSSLPSRIRNVTAVRSPRSVSVIWHTRASILFAREPTCRLKAAHSHD